MSISVSFALPPFSSTLSNRTENLIISSFCCRSSFLFASVFPIRLQFFMRLTGLVAKCRAIDLLLWVILVGASFRSFGAQVAQQAFVYGFGQSSKKNTKTASFKTAK